VPTLDDLAVQTIGEQEWMILRLEDENRRLRDALRAQEDRPDDEEVSVEWPTESPG